MGVAALVLAGLICACGAGSADHVPDVNQLPLLGGAHVVAQVRRCDRGASAYCGIELVVVDRAFDSADAMFKGERALLDSLHWTNANGDIGDETAADSPGHKLHLSYATAAGDLKGIDLGWIQRQRTITLALDRTLFDRTAALSMLLEVGVS